MNTETKRRRFLRWTAFIFLFRIDDSLCFTEPPLSRIAGYPSLPKDVFLPQLNEAPIGENYGDSDDPFDYDVESVPPATLRMDDGGSDLTDRFKYKVHALMGSFDPPAGTTDDENQTGNIMGALLNFPTEYTFSVVGKATTGEDYAEDVKKVISAIVGENANLDLSVVPRGKKFTKVSAKLTVESACVIASIYNELDAMEATVMKF